MVSSSAHSFRLFDERKPFFWRDTLPHRWNMYRFWGIFTGKLGHVIAVAGMQDAFVWFLERTLYGYKLNRKHIACVQFHREPVGSGRAVNV